MISIKSKFSAIGVGIVISIIFCLSFAQNAEGPKPPLKVGYPLMESPHSNPIAINGDYVYVTNTPSATVDVIDRHSEKVVDRIHVGIDPVAIAVRPDGKEIWVSNHVSDSVSVIDSDPQSPTFHVVIATIQEFDGNKATNFDEPVGIAFASNEKAYVALSSENQIAVIDVASRNILYRKDIRSQDPRAIAVRNGKLYVLPFESNNQTQLSGGTKNNVDGITATFDAFNFLIKEDCHNCPNLVMDVVKRKEIPDRDLYIFDTTSDQELGSISTIGTLLYGLVIDAKGGIYIAQTDARNHINGRAGTKKHGLSDLENRPYLNQIANIETISWSTANKEIIDLDFIKFPHSETLKSFATPYALALSLDETLVFGTAAASESIFVFDSKNKKLLDSIKVGKGPRGIVLDYADKVKNRAWIYNAFENSISVVDIQKPTLMKLINQIQLNDPTEEKIKLGRIGFNSAEASTTQTFSCASCHPDGHTDQLLWILDTPPIARSNQIPPRLTTPVRGLRDTAPFHWDGSQGDPYGGISAASNFKRTEPNCTEKSELSCLRHLIDNNLATTMRLIKDNPNKRGAFTDEQRNNLAAYLLSIPYPSAPKRPFTDIMTSRAQRGFSLFHIEGDINPKMSEPNICGNCHRMPFWTSTKTTVPILWGMDVPTWRGAYDRFQNQAQGRNRIVDYPWIRGIEELGSPEKKFWQLSWSGDTGPRQRFDPVWDMVLEGSTGFSGSFARQLTLSQINSSEPLIAILISALESSAAQGTVVLEAEGVFIDGDTARKFEIQFDAAYKGGVYVEKSAERKYYSRSDLIKLAGQGKFIGTFTARHGAKADLFNYPQPAIWSLGPIQQQRGKQSFPVVTSTQKSMTISGRHFKDDAHIFVDGVRIDGSVSVKEGDKVTVSVANLPPVGMHLLQIQVPEGRMSNDFIFHVK